MYGIISKSAESSLFPIVSVYQGPEPTYDFLGTGFYIDSDGLFLTAKHVCQVPENEYSAVMLGLSGSEPVPYRISHLKYSENFDIALGQVEGVEDIQPLKIASANAPVNYDVVTAEFSGTRTQRIEGGRIAVFFYPYYRKGNVVCFYPSTFPESVPTSCQELSFPALKGASGAPVIVEQTGLVIGMIVGNIQRELLPAQIESFTNGEKYTEEVKYVLPSAKAISWGHLAEFVKLSTK